MSASWLYFYHYLRDFVTMVFYCSLLLWCFIMSFSEVNSRQLRRQLRKQRLRLSKRQRQQAAYLSLRRFTQLYHPALNGKNIKVGLFVDAFGEMPTQPLLNWARKHHCKIYLPVVTGSDQPLVFIEFKQKTWRQSRLPRHPLGMRQPETGKKLKASELDVLVMPLVAADKFGNRMGMGGGYYDRTLAKVKNKPLKIGWAYDFQVVEKLQSQPWDIKLDILITPSKLWLFRRYLMQQNTSQTNFENSIDLIDTRLEDDNVLEKTDEISNSDIASVMNVDRLNQLLRQADAFTLVNSEDLDDF